MSKLFKILTIVLLILIVGFYINDIIISIKELNNPSYNSKTNNRGLEKDEVRLKPYYKTITDIENLNVEKQLIIDKLNGIDIFEDKNIKIESIDIMIFCNDRHGKASGAFTLRMSLSSRNKILDILKSISEEYIVGKDESFFSIIDSENTIFNFDNLDSSSGKSSINLQIVVRLPYVYNINEIDNNDEFVKYFLEINQKNIE